MDRRPTVLYTRELPGGGYVAIEAVSDAGEQWHARVSVERRAEVWRRAGHTPPVIAEATGPTQGSVLKELYRIASDNVAVASGILRWQVGQRRH